MHRGVALRPQAVLALHGEDPGGEDRVAVVDKDLHGAAVDEEAQVEEPLGQRAAALLALLRVEAPGQAGAVHGDGLFPVVVGDQQTAAAVGAGEQPQLQIPAAADQLQFADAGEQVGGLRIQLFPAQRAQLVQRLLDQAAVSHPQLPGQGQAAGPVLLVGGVGRVGQTHPGHQRGLVFILGVRGALGCIGIEAEVQHVEAGVVRGEDEVFPVHFAQQVAAVVDGAAPAGKDQVLGAEDQHVVLPDGLDGGALPHIAEVLEARDLQLSGKRPALRRGVGAVDDHAALFLAGLGADDQVILPGLFVVDDLGVPLMLRIAVVGPEQGRQLCPR